MKITRLLFFAVALTALSLILTACTLPFELPFDIPFLGGEATTEAVTTTAPTEAVTTTTGVVTLPPAPITSNPFKEVKSLKSGLRVIHQNGKTTSVEPELTLTEGRNGVTYSYSLDAESGVLTMTLYNSAAENIALSHLGTTPASLTVKLRESNKNLEWAYADSDDWSVLCKATDNTQKPLAALCEATGFATNEMPTDGGVVLVISGNNIRFRSRNWMNEGYDICNDALINDGHDGRNGIFMLQNCREIDAALPLSSMSNGTAFKSLGDEIAPVTFNGTTIGAKHGYYLVSEVPNNGLTEKDIGRVFTRERDGQQYVLVKVGDVAWFCPFDEAAMESGDFTSYCYPEKGILKANDALTYNDGKKAASFTVTKNATHNQLRTAVNNHSQSLFLNGTTEIALTNDGVYQADFVDFCEQYSVIYLPSMLSYLMENVGDNTNASFYSDEIEDSYVTFTLTHRFHNNGSYTLYETFSFEKDVEPLHAYGVMSGSFANITEQYVYVPGSDDAAVPTLHVPTAEFHAHGDATCRSFFHMTDANGTKAMNVGYYPYFGVATDENRPEALSGLTDNEVGWWYTSMKMYPYLFNVASASAGDSLSFIGYHTPSIRFDEDFFAINWYFVGDEIYLSMHTDKAVGERTVAIPNAAYLTGLTITVDEASDGFTVLSDTVTAEGITVSTTGAGYVTLKLTK